MRLRGAALLLLAAVCGCAPRGAPQPAALPEVPEGLCRVGADGAMPVAERGIGGTGAPATRVADRGIGGTGAPGARTGIVGVITGFASVCLAGQEVGYAPDLPVLVDGRASGLDALRAGQVAVVVAEGASPLAASLAIRHEVSGPVERVEADGTLRVAGQRVVPPPGAVRRPGDWVLVSGFRREDGVIAATRLDARPPGEVLVRGILRMAQGRLWIGLVEVRPGRFQERTPGVPVVAIGRLNDGVLEADTVEADALLVDPARFFGPAVGVLVLEGYAEGGVFRFGRGLQLGAPFAEGRGLARLQRGPGGQFTPDVVRPGGMADPGRLGAAPRTGFDPAPVPNRGMERAGRGDAGGRGAGPRAGGGRREGAEGQGRRAGEGADVGSGPGGPQGGGPGGPGGGPRGR